jgi:ubiquinone biosynthesis accessory factor UbiK
MNRQAIFNDIQDKVLGFLRNSPAGDIEKNIKAVMAQGFQKLDLVTREEFDLQREILERTRTQLAALEKKVSELEK